MGWVLGRAHSLGGRQAQVPRPSQEGGSDYFWNGGYGAVAAGVEDAKFRVAEKTMS